MALLLSKIVPRSEYLAVVDGRILLRPKTGNTATSDDWLKDNHDLLLNELIALTGKQAFIYHGYTTGNYTNIRKGKSPGITLQLINAQTGESSCITYNVGLTRDRNTPHGKKGSLLPKGRFNAGGRIAFLKFWDSTGLGKPKRPSAYYDCMGKLKAVIFTGEMVEGKEGRLSKDSFKPLNISFEEIQELSNHLTTTRQAPDNHLTTTRQQPDSDLTRMPDKEIATDHVSQGLEPILIACSKNRVITSNVIKSKVIKVKELMVVGNDFIATQEHGKQACDFNDEKPKEQTVDEWLASYNS